MKGSKESLCPEDRVVKVIAVGNSENYRIAVDIPPSLPAALARSPMEIANQVKESVVTRLALREEQQKLAQQKGTKVGYSKPYADNWELIFGDKDKN